jgi:phage/plasmid primase-like uncharacterized protein
MRALALSPDAVASLARRLFGEPNRRLSSARELRWGRQGSLAVVPARGVFTDYESGVSGGVLDMVCHAGAAISRAEAAKLLAEGGELPERETEPARTARQLEDAKRAAAHVATAGTIWNRAVPIRRTVAEIYLRTARKTGAPLDRADLRFNSAAPLFPYSTAQQDHRPAMVAAVRNGRGRFIGAHVTYLRPDGRGKADVTTARKMVGAVGGGHVRLIPGRRLVVAEGLESALSAWETAAEAEKGSSDDLGAISALSAGGMAGLEWPAPTTALIIAPDRDTSGRGEEAARALARRADASGLVVGFLYPPDGCGDWNDAARQGGAA